MTNRDGISDPDKQSILGAAAADVRANLEVMAADSETYEYDDPDEGPFDHLKTLRRLDIIVRDNYAHGLTRPFGTREYEMHLFDSAKDMNRDDLARLREIIGNAEALTTGFSVKAENALRVRNIDVTPTNLSLARKQMMVGTILAIREASAALLDPAGSLDAMLASLEMSSAVPMSFNGDIAPNYVPAAGQVTGDGAAPMTTMTVPMSARSTTAADETPVGRMRIKQAAATFLSANQKYDVDSSTSHWTMKTRTQFYSAIFLADKFFGPNRAVSTVDEMAIAGLLRILRELPSNRHKTPSHAGMSLDDIIARKTGHGLGLATTNRHIRFIKLVFDWAKRHMTNAPSIDWSAFIQADRRLKRDKRDAFESAELEAIFSGAVWHGSESVVRR